MVITLAKALQKKNALAGEIKELRTLIQCKNRYSNTQRDSTIQDTNVLMVQHNELVDKMVRLKHALQVANVPIYREILQLSESKGMLAFLNSLECSEETTTCGYGTERVNVEWFAHIKEPDVKQMKDTLKAQVESLMDTITAFNYSTKIDVEI